MRTIEPGAIWRGALAGLLVIVPVTALRAALDAEATDLDGGGWLVVFGVALLAAYVIAGAVAGHRAAHAPYTNGILAGVGALVLWLPLRVLIWVARSESQGLVDGRDPVFTLGQLFGQLLFAAAFGLIGGIIGARRSRGPGVDDRPAAEAPAPPRG